MVDSLVSRLLPRSGKPIFVSYRHLDSGHSGRLADAVKRAFPGARRVLLDHEAIEAGRNLREWIREVVPGCLAVVAAVGPNWLRPQPVVAEGEDEPPDYVRLELETARAAKVPIVPVLVNGARMPRADELPDGLEWFGELRAVGIDDEHWEAGVEKVIAALRGYDRAGRSRSPLRRWAPVALVVAAAAGIGGAALLLGDGGGRGGTRVGSDSLGTRTDSAERTLDSLTGLVRDTLPTVPAESLRVVHLPPDDRGLAMSMLAEYGRPINYGAVHAFGWDLMAGMPLASLRAGSLSSLVSEYVAQPRARYGDALREYLPRLERRDTSLISDERLQSLLRRAGADSVMVRVQRRMVERGWAALARREAEANGLRSRLGAAVIADAIIQGGPGGHERALEATIQRLGGTPLTGIDERQWIIAYLEARRQRMAEGTRFPENAIARRFAPFLEQARAGNLELERPITVGRYLITD